MKEEESNKRSNIEMGKTLKTILRKKSQHQMPMLADGNSSNNINNKNADGMNLFNLDLTYCLTTYSSVANYLKLLTQLIFLETLLLLSNMIILIVIVLFINVH